MSRRSGGKEGGECGASPELSSAQPWLQTWAIVYNAHAYLLRGPDQFHLVESQILASLVRHSGVTFTIRPALTRLFKMMMSLVNIPKASGLAVLYSFFHGTIPFSLFYPGYFILIFLTFFLIFLFVACPPTTRSKLRRQDLYVCSLVHFI